jgi:hypothetical protein
MNRTPAAGNRQRSLPTRQKSGDCSLALHGRTPVTLLVGRRATPPTAKRWTSPASPARDCRSAPERADCHRLRTAAAARALPSTAGAQHLPAHRAIGPIAAGRLSSPARQERQRDPRRSIATTRRPTRGPQREPGRSGQYGESEDPDPRAPHGQAVKVAAADNRQARTHHRHADQAAISRRQAGLAPGPLTRSMSGVMQAMKGRCTAHRPPTRPRPRRRTRQCQPLRACGPPQARGSAERAAVMSR